jgi:phosphoglycerate dehydrogenase-like enzyme
MTLRVLLADPRRDSQRAWWANLFPPELAVGLAPATRAPDAWRALLPESDVLVGYAVPLVTADLERAERLRLVVQLGVHAPSFDLELLRERGIPFRVERDVANVAVAEHAFLLMLALVRRLGPVTRMLADNADPQPRAPTPTAEESYAFNWPDVRGIGLLAGQTLGMVGLGEIGLEMARRARSFGMRVLYTRRHRLAEVLEADLGVEYRTLEALLADVDVLSLHAPHTVETQGLVGPQALARMRRGAYVVNTSRGGLIDEDALVEALRSGHIAGAGLDVFREEPLPRESLLRTLPNVLLTPHVGAIRAELLDGSFRAVVDRIAAFARGQDPPGAEADLVYVTGAAR